MIFAVDVGNTNIVLGCIEDGKILNTARIRTEINATSTEYAIKIREVLSLFRHERDGFKGAILSSVVPQLNNALSDAIKLVTGEKCIIVGPGMKTGISINIDDPGTLGCDLLVGAVAAAECYGYPAIIIDMGTATTITVLNKNGAFGGGAIMPGVRVSINALSSGTSLLPSIAIVPPKKAIGTNTADCMRSGVVLGAASMIDGMIDRFQEEMNAECRLVATGGLASAIVKECRHDIVCDDDLLLKGLWILYCKNRKQGKETTNK